VNIESNIIIDNFSIYLCIDADLSLISPLLTVMLYLECTVITHIHTRTHTQTGSDAFWVHGGGEGLGAHGCGGAARCGGHMLAPGNREAPSSSRRRFSAFARFFPDGSQNRADPDLVIPPLRLLPLQSVHPSVIHRIVSVPSIHPPVHLSVLPPSPPSFPPAPAVRSRVTAAFYNTETSGPREPGAGEQSRS